MRRLILLLCAAATISVLGGCQAGDDGAPADPNAATSTPGAPADPALNVDNTPPGAQTGNAGTVSSDPKAGLNPNAKPPTGR